MKGMRLLLLGSAFLGGACTYKTDYSLMLAPVPPTSADLAITGLERFNHDVPVLGIVCRAHDYRNDMSDVVRSRLISLDRNGQLDLHDATLLIEVEEVRGDIRCYLVGVGSGACRARLFAVIMVRRGGEADAEKLRFEVETEEPSSQAFCGNHVIAPLGMRLLDEITQAVRARAG